MNRAALIVIALLLFAGHAPAQPPPAPPQAPVLSVDQFAAELNSLSVRVGNIADAPADAAALRDSLPRSWKVEMDGQTVEVPAEWLRAGLDRIAKDAKQAQSALDLQKQLEAMRDRARATSASSPAAYPTERARADEILSRREFSGVEQPSWLDELRDRIFYWIDRMLGRTLGRLAGQRRLGNILMWLVIAVAAIVAGLLVRRALSRAAAEDKKEPESLERMSITWREWLEKASQAAARGNHREALRCAYWAAIYRLELLGLWRPDPTRTPREYLRAMPSGHVKRPPLLSVTRNFENAWYAQKPVTAADYQQSVAELEKLGCALPSTAATEKS